MKTGEANTSLVEYGFTEPVVTEQRWDRPSLRQLTFSELYRMWERDTDEEQ